MTPAEANRIAASIAGRHSDQYSDLTDDNAQALLAAYQRGRADQRRDDLMWMDALALGLRDKNLSAEHAAVLIEGAAVLIRRHDE